MILDRFDRSPSDEMLKKGLIVFFILFVITCISVNYAFEISNYPVSFTESQLSFSGQSIKSHYAQMTDEDIGVYIMAQGVDYAYLFCYGGFILLLGVFIGRKWFTDSSIRYGAYIMGCAGIIAAICDAIEDAFIIAMAKNPVHFPDSYAIAHSYLASIKFALLGLAIVMVLVFSVIKVIKKGKR